MDDDNTPSLRGGQAKLAQDLQTLLADAQELMRLAAGEAGQGIKEARERLERSTQAARQQLATMQSSAVDSAREAGRNADSYVRQHPWEAIGIGAGVGLLLGILMARR
jgi:ElaB/YqjD/DUF883 family membrane-anchored ribosome-binding protein